MKRVIALIVLALFLSSVLVSASYAGWKENYRTKYSKKTLDPNSEKAKKIRRLCNFDFKFLDWRKRAEEKKAQGIEPTTSLSAKLMPWKREKEEKDTFEGYTTNISPGNRK